MKKIFLTIMITAMLIFAGCTGEGGSSSSSTSGGQTFKGGDKALELTFENGMPPAKILDQGKRPYQIRMKIKNEGEYSIEDKKAHVVITGIDEANFNLVGKSSQELPAIRGYKKQGSQEIKGGEVMAMFSDVKYMADIFSGSMPVTFFADLCYPYETQVSSIVCINGDTSYKPEGELKVCDLEGTKSSTSSGAPVSIENVKQLYGGNDHSIMLNFDIVHKPTSTNSFLFERNSLDSKCKIGGVNPMSNVEKKNKVTYLIETEIGGKKFNCENGLNQGTIILSDNRYPVSCTLDTTSESEYNKPIKINLKYDYLERFEKTITVEHYGN